MYDYIVHNSITSWMIFLESMFGFSHLMIRGLIKGLNSNYDILSTCFCCDPQICIVNIPFFRDFSILFQVRHFLFKDLSKAGLILFTCYFLISQTSFKIENQKSIKDFFGI